MHDLALTLAVNLAVMALAFYAVLLAGSILLRTDALLWVWLIPLASGARRRRHQSETLVHGAWPVAAHPRWDVARIRPGRTGTCNHSVPLKRCLHR